MQTKTPPGIGSDVSGRPDAKAELIFSAIISEHLVTGEPVGSKAVSERFANATGMSSATVRNVMSDLEELGLLEQPHTSAGRVPTDSGYRYYVDNLLGVLKLSDDDLLQIQKELGINDFEIPDTPEKLMERTSHVLSALSQNVGIVVSPSLANDKLQHIEFVNLSENRVLVVLVSAPNIVHNKIIRMNETVPQEELDRTARYLNVEFSGKSLAEIRSEILRLMHEDKALFDKLLQTAMILCSQSIEDDESVVGEVYIEGMPNILNRNDFGDIDRLRELLKTMEEKSRLVKILNECISRDNPTKGGVQVVIGNENVSTSMKDCTLITAPYSIGDGSTFGTLTVLGPTRIEYARMISIVGYVAKLLEKIISAEQRNPR
jgi:heat-inducible transcriptional repressor